MSDVSELYFLDRESRPTWCELESKRSPYLLSASHLPIVWLALFQEQDARLDINCVKDRNRAYFAAERGKAIANLEQRKPWIRAAVPGLEVVWLDSFARLLSGCERSWVHVQPLSFGPDGSAPRVDELKQLLEIFEAPPIPLGAGTQGSVAEPSLYREHFSSRFHAAKCHITFASLGASGSEILMVWEC